MYVNHTITVRVAQDRRRDMLAAAESARLARQARSLVDSAGPPAGSRSGARKLLRQLRPQAQS